MRVDQCLNEIAPQVGSVGDAGEGRAGPSTPAHLPTADIAFRSIDEQRAHILRRQELICREHGKALSLRYIEGYAGLLKRMETFPRDTVIVTRVSDFPINGEVGL